MFNFDISENGSEISICYIDIWYAGKTNIEEAQESCYFNPFLDVNWILLKISKRLTAVISLVQQFIGKNVNLNLIGLYTCWSIKKSCKDKGTNFFLNMNTP